MFSQTISWFAWFSTKIIQNGDPSDVICLNVVPYLFIPDSLLSTHFTHSCSSLAFVRISIVTEYYHWLDFFVQTLNFCVVTCRSNPWPSECLPRMKCTPQQCNVEHKVEAIMEPLVPRRGSNLGPLGWQPSTLTTRLSKLKLGLVLGLGSGLCPLATCSKQSFSATSVAKGSLECYQRCRLSVGQPVGLVSPNF